MKEGVGASVSRGPGGHPAGEGAGRDRPFLPGHVFLRLGAHRCWESQILSTSLCPPRNQLFTPGSRGHSVARELPSALEGVPRGPRCVLADSGLCQLGSGRPGSGPLPLGQQGAKSCPRVCGFVLGVCLGPGLARGLDHLSRASQSRGHITLRT